MDAGGVNIKQRILMTRKEYSVLKEGIKDDECGWSHHAPSSRRLPHLDSPAHPPKLLERELEGGGEDESRGIELATPSAPSLLPSWTTTLLCHRSS
jgi:hypothetical protein